MMTEFTVMIKNKVRMTGIIEGSGYKICNSKYLYGLTVLRPRVEENEQPVIDSNNCVMDFYSLLIDKDDLSEGDIVEVEGVYGAFSGFDHKMVCPICGKEQTNEKIRIPVIKYTDIKIVQSGKYFDNFNALCDMSHRFNYITVYDIPVDGVLFMQNEGLGMDNTTIYKSTDIYDAYNNVLIRKSSVEFLDRIDNYYHPIKGVIHKAKGSMALYHRVDDHFFCERCHSSVTVDTIYPLILFNKKPELETDGQETQI